MITSLTKLRRGFLKRVFARLYLSHIRQEMTTCGYLLEDFQRELEEQQALGKPFSQRSAYIRSRIRGTRHMLKILTIQEQEYETLVRQTEGPHWQWLRTRYAA